MERNEELESMLVKFYNMQAGTAFRTGNPMNTEWAFKLLEACEGDATEAKNRIKRYVSANPQLAKEMFGIKQIVLNGEGAEEAVPEEPKVAESLGILEKALVEVIKTTSIPKIEEEIMSGLQQNVRDFIMSEYGPLERKITTVIDGKKYEPDGTLHEKFETVVKFVSNDVPVFLTGPAGSGKNYLCKQVADALGLDFYFTNAVTQRYQIEGFTDAMGNYQETQFYKAFKNGGLFMLDEIDASIPDVLIILNAALANRYFDFPAPIGFVKASPNFRVIAAGNTIGHGADYEYVGRSQLDGASLDRFALVKVDYSEAIENSSAGGDIELASFCREYREAAKKVGVQTIVSYRAIRRLATMIPLLNLTEALETCLLKGLEKDDINIICNELPDSKYRRAMRKACN